jgi:hypothetical protein
LALKEWISGVSANRIEEKYDRGGVRLVGEMQQRELARDNGVREAKRKRERRSSRKPAPYRLMEKTHTGEEGLVWAFSFSEKPIRS